MNVPDRIVLESSRLRGNLGTLHERLQQILLRVAQERRP